MKGLIRWVSPVLLAGSFLLSTNAALAANSPTRDVAQDYIQHNPEVPDGKAPFVGYFSGYFKENPQSRARIVRSATDGDLVYLHVHSTNGKADRGQAVIDIFRVQDGKLVEHWDVIQAVPEQAANSNTMF
ncbi:nuclear transport factor 2 family protein [Alcaligenes faecalis]|uniref:nuclear transport factor 2 family protein n=1 Tax=Alcaligenes faecalis TaxID=511 RepID=UPI000F0BBBB3|nr:nuclear transport factor 2 family protein [Alcaligenes faecalis]AYR21659.1 hypothetical protein D6I95_15660 [Alcaligenes faecalis]